MPVTIDRVPAVDQLTGIRSSPDMDLCRGGEKRVKEIDTQLGSAAILVCGGGGHWGSRNIRYCALRED